MERLRIAADSTELWVWVTLIALALIVVFLLAAVLDERRQH